MVQKKTGCQREPVLELGEKGSTLFNFSNGFADGGIVQDLLAVDVTCNQGRGAHAVNLAREALGVLEDAFEGIVSEGGAGGEPGNSQVMLFLLRYRLILLENSQNRIMSNKLVERDKKKHG